MHARTPLAPALVVLLTACQRHPAPGAPHLSPVTEAAVAASPAVPPAPACSEPERRQLDFWLGDWDVAIRVRPGPTSDAWTEARGMNVVRPILGGCAVEESFHGDGPGAPWAGRSFSTYWPRAHEWRQTWVDDSGSYLAFRGGPEGDSFVLDGERPTEPGKTRQMRMVFKDIARDSLFWSWEQRAEAGTAWAPVMTIAYTRRPAAPPQTSCDASPAFHELDFWLGHWRVTEGGKLAGTNTIEKTLAGCAVAETWKDADGSEGKSLFFHPPASSTWKQVWITSAATALGGAKEKQLIGRGPDGAMRFQGELPLPGGGVLLDRTTLTPVPGGRVHQVIETSRDDGAHWKVGFDAMYDREP